MQILQAQNGQPKNKPQTPCLPLGKTKSKPYLTSSDPNSDIQKISLHLLGIAVLYIAHVVRISC